MGSGDRGLKSKEATASESSDNKLNKIQAPGLSATKPATAEEAQPTGAGAGAGAVKKRKKLVKTRLPKELVDEIMARPITPSPVIHEELLAGLSEACRAAFAMQKAATEELMALDADIIQQFKDYGYAEMEEEVTDDEEEKVQD